MLRGAATTVWSRRRRGGDQNLDPDGSTCSSERATNDGEDARLDGRLDGRLEGGEGKSHFM